MTSKFTVKSFYGGPNNQQTENNKKSINNLNDILSIYPLPTTLPSSQKTDTSISSLHSTTFEPSEADLDTLLNSNSAEDDEILDIIKRQHQLNIDDDSFPNIKVPTDLPITNNPNEFSFGIPNSTADNVHKSIPPISFKPKKSKSRNTSNAEISLSMQDDKNYLYALKNKILHPVDEPQSNTSSAKSKPKIKTPKQSNKRSAPVEESPVMKRQPRPITSPSIRSEKSPGKNVKEQSLSKKKVKFEDPVSPKKMKLEKSATPLSTDDKFMERIVTQNSHLQRMSKAMPQRKTVVTTDGSTTSIDKHSLEKLKELISDIFDAEDSLISDSEVPKVYAKCIKGDGSLQPSITKELSSYLNQLYASKPNSILELANNEFDGTTQSELVTKLARLIKILDKSVMLGDKLSVWNPENQDDFDESIDNLHLATESIAAVECILLIMKFDQLPKQLYFEDILSQCLSVFKYHLNKTIYAYVEAIEEGYSNPSNILAYAARENPQPIKKPLSILFNTITSVIPSLNALMSLSHVSLGDSVLITATYISIGPFFVAEPTSLRDMSVKNALSPIGGGNGMRELRLIALTLIQNIFSNYDAQRNWIIDEILSAAIKLPELKKQSRQYQLKSGKTIYTLSALLLQLVQACSHSTYEKINNLRYKHQLNVLEEEAEEFTKTEAYTEFVKSEVALWESSLYATANIAQAICYQLITHLCQSKSSKSSHEADYKLILENLINDTLTVLYIPEWQGASWLLLILLRLMERSVLEDNTTSNTEVVNIKSIALDHFGNIFAKLRQVDLERIEYNEKASLSQLTDIERAVWNGDLDELSRLHTIHQTLMGTLFINGSQDDLCISAYELLGSSWGYYVVKGLKASQSKVDNNSESEAILKEQSIVQEKLLTYIHSIWIEDDYDLDAISRDRQNMDELENTALQLTSLSPLQKMQDVVLYVIIQSFTSKSVSVRARAVKALGLAIMSDNTLLNDIRIQNCIGSRVKDVASSVRDAALDVLSKHLTIDSGFANDYFEIVSDRIDDESPAVRKRVVKLLKDIYVSTDDLERKAEIGKMFCMRIVDEDDLLKNLALEVLDNLWLNLKITKPSKATKDDHFDADEEVASIDGVVDVLMEVTKLFGDRYNLFEQAMEKIVSRHPKSHQLQISNRFKHVVAALIERIDNNEEDSDLLACVRTILVLAGTIKGVVGGAAAEQLLPLLVNGITPEQKATSEATLKVFKKIIPLLSRSSTKLTADLQDRLLPLISSPNNGIASQALSEAVACLCSVVNTHTYAFVSLSRMLMKAALETHQLLDERTRTVGGISKCKVLIIIMGLLVEHCDFESVRNYDDMNISRRAQQQYYNAACDLDKLVASLAPEENERDVAIQDSIWRLLIDVRRVVDDPAIQAISLRGLGCIFVGYPYLMNEEESIAIMDNVFADTSPTKRIDHSQLLLVFQEYLKVDEQKKNAKVDEVDAKQNAITVEHLIGDADQLNDSNVGPRILQRYLKPILASALSYTANTSLPAIDVLGCMFVDEPELVPTLVALQTSPSGATSAKARDLHVTLYNKYASVLNTHHILTIEKAFDYHYLITGNLSGMRNNRALLETWFGLMSEKRPAKLDFLSGILRFFDKNPATTTVTDHSIQLSRFIADNLLAFNYQHNEDVLFVGRMLSTYLATHGEQLRDDIENADTNQNEIRLSVIYSICIAIRNNLKSMYGFTDKQFIEYKPKKKSTFGDRQITSRDEVKQIPYDIIPGATKSMKSDADHEAQIQAYFDLMNDTGDQMNTLDSDEDEAMESD
ncbi:hypothetical protein E3Q23_02817 [Wallemia mellicola]|nr:hypothetical protein E3Q23_02817 [Wallemia mellicola]